MHVRICALGTIAFVAALATVACAPGPGGITNAETACQSTTAKISVGEGFLTDLCGCTEADGTTTAVPNTLICTVPSGTTVYFIYPYIHYKHQIWPTGTPLFPSSPVFDPDSTGNSAIYAVTFATAGSYAFTDSFYPVLSGQIVVTP